MEIYSEIILKKQFHLHKNEHFVCVSFCILTKCLFTVDIVVMYVFLRFRALSLSQSSFVVFFFLIHVNQNIRIYELLYSGVFGCCFVCVFYIYNTYQDANTVITRSIFDLCLAQLFIRPIYYIHI